MNVLQIGAGVAIFGYFSDAAVLGIAAIESGEYRADLRLSFAAVALDNHHALTFVAGDQAVADILL